MKHLIPLSVAAVAACIVTGCKTAEPSPDYSEVRPVSSALNVTNQPGPDLLKPGEEQFTLGPGDQLEIEISDDPESKAVTTVGLDGKIYFNILPGTDVWGLSLSQTRERLKEELSRFIISTPDVQVRLKAVGSRHVWLTGRLNTPGIYPLNGPTTLLEAIALAGGPQTSDSLINTEDLADLRHSFIVRRGTLLPVNFYSLLREGDMSQNIYLAPDDFVFVPSLLNQDIYVLGAVGNPGAFAYSESASLIKTIAQANGTVKDAYLSHVAIVRGSLTEPQLIVVDYKDIVTGNLPDVPLEARDIVYVPLSPYRTLTRYLKLIADSFASTIAANEGARFVSDSGANVGISTPVTPP